MLTLANALHDPPAVIQIHAESVPLLGRGIQNRATGETLALQCIDECSRVRMIYFPADQKLAFAFGPELKLSEDGSPPSDRQIRTEMKKHTREFRRHRRGYNLSYRADRMRGKMLLVTLGTAALFALATTTAPVVVIPAALITFVGGGLTIVLSPGLFKYTPATASFSNTEGWGWSENPKRVSPATFEILLDLHKKSLHSPQEFEQVTGRKTSLP